MTAFGGLHLVELPTLSASFAWVYQSVPFGQWLHWLVITFYIFREMMYHFSLSLITSGVCFYNLISGELSS